MLGDVGVVKLNYNETSSTIPGSGGVTVNPIGNYDLTSAYQTIYQKIGQGTFSGIYAGNIYLIKAREVSQSQLQFRIEFNDVVTDPNIDNNVDGRLESSIQHYRATGAYVSVDAPSYYNNNTLA